MSNGQRSERARELLGRCAEEVGDRASAAVLRAEFVRVLDSESAMSLLEAGQFCRAFALAAAELACSKPLSWSRERLEQLADMCFHNGDSDEANELLDLAKVQT